MRLATVIMLLAVTGSRFSAAQSNAVASILDTNRLQYLAFEYLEERYPNIEPSRFVFRSGIGGTYVFGDKDTIQDRTDRSERAAVAYGTQYLIRLKPDGELISIQKQERNDGILEISPAPNDFPIRVPFITPDGMRTNHNRIIVIPPEIVPQQR